MKEIIESFINQNKAIASFIEQTSESFQDGSDVLPEFLEKLKQTKFNISLGNSFADLLQLSNDKGVYEQYSLADIGKLYSTLLEIQETNLENYIDAAYFQYSVMDNLENAKRIANAGIEKARQKIEELQHLLETISNEGA